MRIPEGPLTILIFLGIIIVLSIFLGNMNKPRNIAAKKNLKEEFEDQVITPQQSSSVSSQGEIHEKGITPAVVAAITASICVMTGKSAEEFKFTAIRRVSGNQPVWSMVGTTDIISTRQRFIERGNR